MTLGQSNYALEERPRAESACTQQRRRTWKMFWTNRERPVVCGLRGMSTGPGLVLARDIADAEAHVPFAHSAKVTVAWFHSNCTTSRCPFTNASLIGVRLSLFCTFIFALLSTSSCTSPTSLLVPIKLQGFIGFLSKWQTVTTN